MEPTFEEDIYADAALDGPYPAYRRIRDLGPAVWMPVHAMWAIGRFEDVRLALRADEVLISGKGVAANALVNAAARPITLTSDGETHLRRRQVLIRPVTPAPLNALRGRLETEADALVGRLAGSGDFDAMPGFAAHLPLTIVAELVGLNDEGRRNMLRWAAATFDNLGVMNDLGKGALPAVTELGRYVMSLDRESVAPDGWAAGLFDAADRGELSPDEASAMVIDYVVPALDTTILATGEMLWRLATTPGAYEAVREEPRLIPSVVNESVRLGSPIKSFTRFVHAPYEVGGIVIPQGARVAILFASANRDERRYEDPDLFKVARNPRDHVGWGHGAHTCVGMHLARLEMEVLLAALVRQIARIEVDRPMRIRNNTLQGFESLPARFLP